MAKMRLAVVGLGMASAPHAKSLQDLSNRVEVAAVFSPSASRRQAFAEHWNMPISDSLDAIVDDASIDALLVLTPPSTHLEIVERAARAGKHVLLEKPLEITTARAADMVEKAETAGIALGVVLQHRFRPVSVALRDIIAQGRLGALVGASAKLSNWRPQSYYDQPGRGTMARDGGGVLLTQGIHTLDLLISLAGPPSEVFAYATTTPVHRMETEDLVAGALRFENGALGTVSATTSAYPGLPDTVELIGTKGTARIEGRALVAQFHDGSEVRQADDGPGGGAGADPMAFPHDHHRAVLADFVDAIENRRPPLVSGREALKVHRLIEALLHSATTRRSATVAH
ncbi:Gfo/Idh/MocA family oxidoreductase [Rhizobiaceae bacterium n13]|uniref:Gfo/Idh/MocA family oxidoreductase n=1 Tax=Ferirhizobium litorale TaxID=2927786 RepID=A0AAE3QBF5_9HYPH|nr:Gfo/Idh/MocA family oxidoreductase [Fererhizobium litorale]MDI7862011.1 Gfo/Idh/MocA family oxidoreductase [Fererhizobium litorale]MDI7922717.1 Gfo/Idh/MocA family oxidoreductase [Fererhizobium litorale]